MEDVRDEMAVGSWCVQRPTESNLQLEPELTILSGEEPVATCAQLYRRVHVHTMMCACVHVRTQATYMKLSVELTCTIHLHVHALVWY